MDVLESVLGGEAVDVARRLIGCELVRTIGDNVMAVRIVETEAYHQMDAASHSFRGKTARTAAMFGSPGFAYVYFTYGMHFCVNVVCGRPGVGAAVLIRAAEPLAGLEHLRRNRPGVPGGLLANGPAKLCQALAIGRQFNGHDLRRSPLQLRLRPMVPSSDIVQTTRIGIRRDVDRPWRFYLKQNPFVSRP